MTGKQHQKYPGHTANNIIIHEFLLIHLHNSGHNGGKSADDGQKPGKYNGLSAMFIIKSFRIVEMFLLEEEIIFSLKKVVSAFFPKPISGHISQNATDGNQ